MSTASREEAGAVLSWAGQFPRDGAATPRWHIIGLGLPPDRGAGSGLPRTLGGPSRGGGRLFPDVGQLWEFCYRSTTRATRSA